MSHITKTICAVLLLASFGLSQQKTGIEKLSTEKQKQIGDADKTFDATRQKALSLLDQLFNTANSFEDDLLKIKIQTQIADLLWEYDEPRARRMFETAFQAIASTKLPAQDKSAPPSYVGADSHYPLRIDAIRFISRRDTALAAKLIDSVVDQPPNVDPKFSDNSYGNYSETDMLRLQFALYITDSDPQRATQIARTFIQKRDIRRAISILESLRGKDALTADDLFAQALSQIKQNKTIATEDIRNFASYLFPDFGEGVILFTSDSGNGSTRGAARSNPALTAQFFDLAYKAVMQWTDVAPKNAGGESNAQAPLNYTVAELLLPYFDKYLSDKAASIRARVSEALSRPQTVEERRATNHRSGTVKEIIGRAETTTDVYEKDRVYMTAVMQAVHSHNIDEARAILDKISDERMRAQAASMLQRAEEEKRYNAAQDALIKGDLETAYRLINELPDLRLRIQMLGNMSLVLFNRNDNARAVQILNEAERLCESSDDSIEKAQRMMHLASIGARFDAARGFADMKMVVEAINHAGFAPKWQKIETINDEKNATTTRKNIGLDTLSGLSFDNGFSFLSRFDFDRALLLAKAVEMKEAAAIMQLSVCRGVLKRPRQVRSQEKAKEPAKPESSGKPKQSN